MHTFEIHHAPLQHPTARDAFIVTVNVTFGDDDAFSSFTVGPFANATEEVSYMSKLVDLLERINALPWHEFHEHGHYDIVDGFNNWFAEEKDGVDQWYIDFTYKTMLDMWPEDPIYNRDGYLRSLSIDYYDANGIEHEVTAKISNEDAAVQYL